MLHRGLCRYRNVVEAVVEGGKRVAQRLGLRFDRRQARRQRCLRRLRLQLGLNFVELGGNSVGGTVRRGDRGIRFGGRGIGRIAVRRPLERRDPD